jgi:hypothetical protein
MGKIVGNLQLVVGIGIIVWVITLFIAGMNRFTLDKLLLLSCQSMIVPAITFRNIPRKKLLFPFIGVLLISIYAILDSSFLFFICSYLEELFNTQLSSM